MTNQEKEKLLKLETYANQMKNKLSEKEVPEKHKNHPKEYKQFLTNELNATEAKIKAIKLGEAGK